MQEYDHDPYAPGPPPAKKGIGGYIATALVAFLSGVLLTSLVLPAVMNWRSIREELMNQEPNSSVERYEDAPPYDNAPTRTAVPTSTPRPAREVPQLGGVAPPSLGMDSSPVVGIAESMGPSVVGVVNKVTPYVRGRRPVDTEQSSGSGIVISADGYIITNNHVVSDADAVTVVFAGGEEVEAEIVGQDLSTDLAVLKVERSGLTPAPLGDSDAVRVGETAIAIGNPLGQQFAGSVTVGVISAKDREVAIDGQRHKLLQTDAAINPGNSGGPLVNAKGEVVGINTMKYYIAGFDDYGNTISTEGIGFAIPINQAIPIAEVLIRDGRIQRPGIGISFQPVTLEEAEAWNAPQTLIIVDVTPGGPADIAGLEVDDILIELNGEPVGERDELVAAVQSHKVGDTITFKIWREGRTHDLDVEVGDLNVINQLAEEEAFDPSDFFD